MSQGKSLDVDNRDSAQIYEYLEARIEALRARILELEGENARLRSELLATPKDDYPQAASA